MSSILLPNSLAIPIVCAVRPGLLSIKTVFEFFTIVLSSLCPDVITAHLYKRNLYKESVMIMV